MRTNFGGTLPSTTCPQHLAESARHAAWAIPDVPCELCLHKLALAVKEKATKETTAPFLLPHCNRQSNSCAQRTQIYPLRKGTMAGASRISSISPGVTKDDLLERIHGLPDKEENRAGTHNSGAKHQRPLAPNFGTIPRVASGASPTRLSRFLAP